MSHIYNFFDDHMEVSGAIVFGIVAVAACVAMPAALAGALYVGIEKVRQSLAACGSFASGQQAIFKQ